MQNNNSRKKKYTLCKAIYGTDIPKEPRKISLLFSYSPVIHFVFTLKCNVR